MIIVRVDWKLSICFSEILLVEYATLTEGNICRDDGICRRITQFEELAKERPKGIPSLTDEPHAQLKSTITLRLLESRFATVLRGETRKPSGKGSTLKGPATRPR